jgi:hypothetical protein
MNSDANTVIKNLKRLSGIRKAVNVRNAPNVRALTWSASSPFVPATAVKPKRLAQAVSRARQGSAEPDRSVAGCHGFQALRTKLLHLASFGAQSSKREHENELGPDSHPGSAGGLGGLEPLGFTQARNSNLNVRFVRDWRSREKGPEFLTLSAAKEATVIEAFWRHNGD